MEIAGYNLRTFVVCVQEMPGREAFIRDHFKARGVDGVETFNGVNGEISGLQTQWPYEVDAPGSGWNMGAKPVAVVVSFWALYNMLNYVPESHFLLLEWDCCFEVGWRARTERALRDVPPDFDALFLGSCCTEGRVHAHVKGDVYDVRYPQCGHAVIIAKKAVPTILRTQRKVYAPWDISLAFHSWPHLKVYTVLPRICTQFNTEIPV